MQQLQKLHCSIAIDKNNFMTMGGRFIVMNSHINGDTPFNKNNFEIQIHFITKVKKKYV